MKLISMVVGLLLIIFNHPIGHMLHINPTHVLIVGGIICLVILIRSGNLKHGGYDG
jgi:hypothetical protein